MNFWAHVSPPITIVQKGRQGKRVRGLLDLSHLYLDTCTSYAGTPYQDPLYNIHEASRGLTMKEVGNLGKIERVWLNEGGISNIVPIEELSKIWQVTYDSGGGIGATSSSTPIRGILSSRRMRRACRTSIWRESTGR